MKHKGLSVDRASAAVVANVSVVPDTAAADAIAVAGAPLLSLALKKHDASPSGPILQCPPRWDTLLTTGTSLQP
jgi:hypothetical protein